MPSIQLNVGMEQFRALQEMAQARGVSIEELLAQAFESIDDTSGALHNLLSYKPLPEYEVTLTPVPPEGDHVSSGSRRPLGLRTKIGGLPDWIHADETPSCPECGRWMAFISQLDSFDHASGGAFVFGDCGMLYTFHCFDCGTSHTLEQSY